MRRTMPSRPSLPRPFLVLGLVGLSALVGACRGETAHEAQMESSAAPAEGGGAAADLGTWTKPADEELRARLTPLQYDVTQEEATEPPFKNAYWDNHADGIYVDVVSGEPLFSSKHKFASGTGWPSFWQPLVPDNLALDTDRKLGYSRDEVRSRHGDSHLGHVFNDGPKPTGLRYCLNSAALRFIPADKLAAEGYGEFAADFEQ